MGFLSGIDPASLHISKFIFHVVHHGKAKPDLLDETPLAGFEDFFLDRIRETLQGNTFVFNDKSPTLKLLQEIGNKNGGFVESSKELAKNFHAMGMKGAGSLIAESESPDLQGNVPVSDKRIAESESPDPQGNVPVSDKRIKAGVLIVMLLQAGEQELYSLIKYDHERVLAYELVTKTRAILEEIKNSFTKSKESLQKSALIRLTKAGGDVIVIDRTVRHDISEFFREFLGVRRKWTPTQMTQQVADAVIKTGIALKDDLPEEVTANIRSRTHAAIQKQDRFGDPSQLVNKVFGPGAAEKVHKTVAAQLKVRGLQGESFKFNKKALAPPKEYKYRTIEGVRIQFGENAKDTVRIQRGQNDHPTIITITTDKLVEY